MSNKKKDFVAETFINLAKVDYRIRFLRWYCNKFANDITIKGVMKSRELKICIEQTNLQKLKITDFVMDEKDGKTSFEAGVIIAE